jgi:hypothetical protein
MRRCIALLFFAGVSLGQKAGDATLSGKITDASTHQPVSSDSSGAFQVRSLVPGTYKGIALTGNDRERRAIRSSCARRCVPPIQLLWSRAKPRISTSMCFDRRILPLAKRPSAAGAGEKVRVEQEITLSEYRKFQTDSRIVSTGDSP